MYIYILNYMCINDEHVWVDSLLALRKATMSIDLFLLGESTKLQAELTIFVKMTLILGKDTTSSISFFGAVSGFFLSPSFLYVFSSN